MSQPLPLEVQISESLVEAVANLTLSLDLAICELLVCRDIFRNYETTHRSKNSLEGDAKATANAQQAERINKAISEIRGKLDRIGFDITD